MSFVINQTDSGPLQNLSNHSSCFSLDCILKAVDVIAVTDLLCQGILCQDTSKFELLYKMAKEQGYFSGRWRQQSLPMDLNLRARAGLGSQTSVS